MPHLIRCRTTGALAQDSYLRQGMVETDQPSQPSPGEACSVHEGLHLRRYGHHQARMIIHAILGAESQPAVAQQLGVRPLPVRAI